MKIRSILTANANPPLLPGGPPTKKRNYSGRLLTCLAEQTTTTNRLTEPLGAYSSSPHPSQSRASWDLCGLARRCSLEMVDGGNPTLQLILIFLIECQTCWIGFSYNGGAVRFRTFSSISQNSPQAATIMWLFTLHRTIKNSRDWWSLVTKWILKESSTFFTPLLASWQHTLGEPWSSVPTRCRADGSMFWTRREALTTQLWPFLTLP